MFTLIVILAVLIADSYGSSFRIVNGTDAEEGEFPFAVSLRNDSQHLCGGTILNEKFILTAAHCVCSNNTPVNPEYFSIQYGLVEITTEPVKTIPVSKIYCNDFNESEMIKDSAVLEHFGPVAKHLQKLEVDIYDDDVCSKSEAISYDVSNHICFGAENAGACFGDSGTALLVEGLQVGIASFITADCGIADKDHSNVYSRVPSYVEWIKKIAGDVDA